MTTDLPGKNQASVLLPLSDIQLLLRDQKENSELIVTAISNKLK